MDLSYQMAQLLLYFKDIKVRVNLNFNGGFNNGYQPRNYTRVNPDGLVNLHYEAIDLTNRCVGKEILKIWFSNYCPVNSTLSILPNGSKCGLEVYRRIVVFDSVHLELSKAKQQVPPLCETVYSYYLDIQNPIKLKEGDPC